MVLREATIGNGTDELLTRVPYTTAGQSFTGDDDAPMRERRKAIEGDGGGGYLDKLGYHRRFSRLSRP